MGEMNDRAARARNRRLAVGTATLFVAVLVALALAVATRQGPPAAPPRAAGAVYRWQPEARPDPLTPLPAFATADPMVARLYRFALARPDLLNYIPCTCGCSAQGHHSNWNCFIQRVGADGTVVFDDMAPG